MSKFEIDAGNYDAHKLMQISEIVVKLKPIYFCTERLLKRCMILENICSYMCFKILYETWMAGDEAKQRISSTNF